VLDLATSYVGRRLINPFVLASAPPTGNPGMIARAFDAGWAGAVIKTLTREPVRNLSNRFASNRIAHHIYGFENIELLSELSPEEWCTGIRLLKRDYPDRLVIGSIMGDASDRTQWIELALGCQEAGADLLELNFSCPHGYPEAGRGAAIGQRADLAAQIVAWLVEDGRVTLPLIPKLTATATDISHVGAAVAEAGAAGLTAINTIPSIMGFDLETLTPRPNVGGYSTYGGYSGPGIKPIALRCVGELVSSPGLSVMGCGGVSSGKDAVEFLLMGAPVVQVCTAVMLNGYDVLPHWLAEIEAFMAHHGFASIADFVGLGHQRIRKHGELDRGFAVRAQIDPGHCHDCVLCMNACRDGGYSAIVARDGHKVVDPDLCVGCSLCAQVCPSGAIQMVAV
jgi:dihydropyrimidine dehydrogenase (NAD+) subunit PreA